MIKHVIVILMFVSNGLFAQEVSEVIKGIMQKQESCWNEGDLECFMNGYWESDSLLFIGKDKVYYGYQNTLKRYQTAYPDKDAMGKLTFSFVYLERLSKKSYYLVGKYHLTRTIGNLEGHFTLLWKKINGNWVIVADHSS